MNPSRRHAPVAELLPLPITILVGHFGAGKTEIAVNLAFASRAAGDEISLVDLDVVKPYFRSRGLIEDLEAAGIQMVAPRDEFAHADLPIVVPEVRAAVGQATAGLRRVVIDVGGAEVGARVLGSIPGLADPRITDVLFIVNGNRPFAETPDAVVSMLREVEAVSRLKVQALIANSHLMDETTADIVGEGIELAGAVGRETGLPVRFGVVSARLIEAVATRYPELPLLPVERHIIAPLDLRKAGSKRRSSIL
ncbi:MAG: hypothetical protein ACM3NQ_03755 [Bacteroidales bacterium]